MPTLISISQDNRLQKKASLLLLMISILFSILLFYYESDRENRLHADIYQSIQASSINSANELSSDINFFKKNVLILSALPSIQHFLHTPNERKTDSLKHDITTAFQALLKQEKNIRQARLILHTGHEYIRVDRSTSGIVVTPKNLLQSKKGRDYFKSGMALKPEELFISDISPNYEHGQIELPLWPTYRIIKALHDTHNNIIGMLVLNIDASSSLNRLNTANTILSGAIQIEHYLINPNGFYIAAPNKALLFGKDLGHKDMNWFVHTEENTPLSSSLNLQTQFIGEHYLFSSKKLTLSNNAGHYFLMTGTPIKEINAFIQSQREQLLTSIAGFVFIILLIMYISLKHIHNLESLYLNQSQFKAIITNSSDAILSINQQGIIQSWNYASSLLFGLKEDDAIGSSFFNLIDENKYLCQDYLVKILKSNLNERIEVPFKSNSIHKRTLLLTICPIQKKGTDNESLALIIRDISHQKENQEMLEAANQNLDSEVKKRTEQLETEKQKAINANDVKSVFVANISHEIRTPLNGISGLLTLARDKANIDKQDDYLKMAQDSAQTLNVLINDLLDLSKIESGKLELSPSPINLILLLESIVSSVFFLIKNKNIELILDTSRIAINHVTLDENRVKQVLTNLLSNAIKFTTEGEITLTASTHYSTDQKDKILCEFQVCDTGMGISCEQQKKLFKPFVQASSGISSKYGGTGLGLSISKQLCEMMGGSIQLDSQSGEGSTFKANILASEASHVPLTYDEEKIKSICNDRVIITFTANDQLRRILRNTLTGWQAAVFSAKNLGELKTLSKTQKPDTLLLDSDFFDADLDQEFSTQSIQVIYLCHGNELDSRVSNTRIIHRPILPTFLVKYLAKEVVEEPLIADISESHTNNTSLEPLTPAQPQPVTPFSYKPGVPKVFIVDDNDINQIVAKGILTTLDLDIDTAMNGKDIIDKLKCIEQSDTLPVILMDCQMPIINGYEATSLIREGKAGAWLTNAPIIALTADAMDQNLENCKSAGMNDFLGKPFEPEVLKETVLKWTKKRVF